MNIVYMAKSAWTGLLDTIRSKAGVTGTMTVSQAADAVQNIPTGGGGNIASVNFKGDNAGAINLTIPYSGDGYPICVCVYPKGGGAQEEIDTIISQYGIHTMTMVKNVTALAPQYAASIDRDKGLNVLRYKQNSTAANRYSGTSVTSVIYDTSNATQGNSACLRIKNNNTVSVYIKDNSTTSYGFLSGIDYTCQVIYSE